MIPMKVWKRYFKMSDKEKQACKKYYAMKKDYEKKVLKAAKDFRPWEPDTLMTALSVMLHYTRDFFNQDYNVWLDKQAPENNFQQTIGSLNECCRCIDELLTTDPMDVLGHYIEARLGSGHFVEEEDGSKVWQADRELTKEETKELKAISKQAAKERDKLKLDLFMTIAKNYERWWD